ncbi:Sugar or nucleoside kinase, ribokinase family [Paraburkholderia susongensis]|uniref:Sugar or nucleoside kinase, ribokinase family n=2 Tax=Paraburkholderia susongensis TaxID=1515439 RepID=A0A1X7HVV3_9BURK|nr:Sugar or nucleoside kinase, ribokinase family [Paraburkholderia susongensis]
MADAVEIVIVASAFGMDAVRAGGHLKWAQAAKRAGAVGFEVRRELFTSEGDANPDAAPEQLHALGAAIAELGLWSVFSTPASLYTPHGRLDTDALRLALDEAAALGARFVKLQLGGFIHDAEGAAIAALVAQRAQRAHGARGAQPRLVVENGQLAQGGSLAQFAGLFDALAREGQAGVLGMTFDIGNWAWLDVAPLDAAMRLAPHVEYIHCKTAAGEGARRFPVAPAADDTQFRTVLERLPRDVPRGIEFPFDASRIEADAAHYVGWLAKVQGKRSGQPATHRSAAHSKAQQHHSTSATQEHSMDHPHPTLDVITYGEAMAMFVAAETGPLAGVGQFTKRVAGADLNVAIGLARLGFKVGWMSRVGDDSFGQYVRDTLTKEGIDQRCVSTDARYPTGFQLKSKNDDGSDPAVEYFRKGSAASHLSLADYVADYVLPARHLHLTGVAPAISASSRELAFHLAREMRAAGRTISFDPNLRPTLWPSRAAMVEGLNALAALADWVLPGIGEGEILTGYTQPEDIASFYLERGARGVIVKLGAQGAYYRTASDAAVIVGQPVAKVVDTVGAGDGFAVGVISALLEGRTLPQAVARGNRIGSLAIQVIGDSEGLPRRAELDALERADGSRAASVI